MVETAVEETDEPADQELEAGTEVQEERSETGEFEAEADVPESADETFDATEAEAGDANGHEPDGDIAERIRLAAQSRRSAGRGPGAGRDPRARA